MRLHTIDNYQTTARYDFLFFVEGERLHAYVDTAYSNGTGIPTIGIGINLREHGRLILQALGFDLSGTVLTGAALTAEQDYINQLLNAFNQNYPSNNTPSNQALAAFNLILQERASNTVYPGTFPRAEQFELASSEVSRQLLNQVLDGYTVPGKNFPGYESLLDTWLTRTGLSAFQPDLMNHDNRERLVLLSLAFNSKTYGSNQSGTPWDDTGLPTLLGPKLTYALLNGDRAEAWFEIRYHSGGPAARRFLEADTFGIYNTDPTEVDYKAAYRTYTRHKAAMDAYETSNQSGLSTAISWGNQLNVVVQNLTNNLQPARTYLIQQYVDSLNLGITIDGNILVGEDQATFYYRKSEDDAGQYALKGTDQNDLIFGESGDDELWGGDGRDVLYGGADVDFLIGGLGDDYLDGGTGEDVYYYYAGNGHDTIQDADNLGRLIYIDSANVYHILPGGRQIVDGSALYEGTDASVQYRYDSAASTLTVLLDGVEAITIQNYNPNLPSLDMALEEISGNLLPTRSSTRPPEQWQTVIQGDQPNIGINDDLHADPVTTHIYGLTGDDVLSGHAGEGGYVPDIQLWGGVGNDALYGEYFYTSQYYFLGQAQFELDYGHHQPGVGVSAYGEAGNDRFLGSLRDDSFDGGTEHDFADGYVGDDTLIGAAGNDMLNGEEGRDTIQGDDGDDRLGGGAGADLLQGGVGNDQLYGDASYGFLTWDGTAGTVLYGDLPELAGRYPIVKDVAEGQAGADTLDGGAGNDEIYGGAGDDLILGGAGLDKLQGEGGDDIIFGGDDYDRIFGDSSVDAADIDNADYLTAGYYTYYWRERHTGPEGNDYVDGGNGNDLIWGGGGNDRLLGGNGADWLMGGLGDGRPSGDDTLEGGYEDDYLFGEDGNDVLSGDAGNDILSGNANDDFLFGGDGDDVLWGDSSPDDIYQQGNEGNDYLDGGANNDTLRGGLGDDVLDGGTGTDALYGGLGNDTYIVGDGSDSISDEGGLDTIQLSGTPANGFALQNVNGSLFVNFLGSAQTLTLTSWFSNPEARIESIEDENGQSWDEATVLVTAGIYVAGTDAADTLTGTTGDDYITDNNFGDDVLTGGAGNDYLFGSNGNDTYVFGLGDGVDEVADIDNWTGVNALRFTAGIDPNSLTLDYTRDSTGEFLRLRVGTQGDTVYLNNFGRADAYGTHAVGLYQFDDGTTLTYQQLIDRGFDIVGTETNDQLNGTSAVDRITGGAGNDSLDGGTGNDVLDGGEGNDSLSGGAGADIYIFARGHHQDTVWDVSSELDTLRFSAGILPSDIMVTRYYDQLGYGQLRLTDVVSGDTITMGAWSGTASPKWQLQFADSTVWDTATLESHIVVSPSTDNGEGVFGTNGNDVIYGLGGDDAVYGFDGDDTLYGDVGNDALYGGNGSDTLNGGVGDDQLFGNAGADILDGGGGNDLLQGDAGIDTYMIGRGNGFDYIIDNNNSLTDRNAVIFGDGITPEAINVSVFTQLWVDDVVLPMLRIDAGLGDGVDIEGFKYYTLTTLPPDGIDLFDGRYYPIKRFLFADGQELSLREMLALADSQANRVLGTAANDTLTGTILTDNLLGCSGNDYLSADAGNDLLAGGAGQDVLDGGAGNDTLLSGVGDGDLLRGGDGDDTYIFDSGDGVDRIEDTSGFDRILYEHRLTGWSTLAVNASGDDLVLSISNTDRLVIAGGRVNNTIEEVVFLNSIKLTNPVLTAADIAAMLAPAPNIQGTSFDDNLTGSVIDENLYGNDGNDVIIGMGGYDLLDGGAGDDTLDGGAGNDTLRGGIGNDTYVVNDAGDTATENANEGTDTVQSSITYTLSSNFENLTLVGTADINGTGNASNNILAGNSGNNVLNGGTGADAMSGGAGNDTYVVDNTGDTVSEIANEGTDGVQSSVTYVLSANVENLTLTGSTAINGTGNSLDNVLTGNSAVNTLTGGAGDDTLNGAAGGDKMYGGAGNDTYVIDNSKDVITENANEGTDTALSSITHTLGSNVENLTLTGTAKINATGNALNNVLTGNTAINTLTGNAGADTLDGGAGNDILNGGTGNDTYIFNRGYGQDSLTDNDTTAGNQDTVMVGVDPLNIVFARTGNRSANLTMSLHGGSDALTVNSWSTASYHTEVFRAADGRQLLDSQVDQIIQAMAQFSASHGGITWDQAIDQNPTEVQAVIAAYWQPGA